MQAAARMGGILSPSDPARNAQDTIAHQQQLLQHARHQARVGSMQAPQQQPRACSMQMATGLQKLESMTLMYDSQRTAMILDTISNTRTAEDQAFIASD